MTTFRHTCLVLAAAAMLAACGGGDPLPEAGPVPAAPAPEAVAAAVTALAPRGIVVQIRQGYTVGPVARRYGLTVVDRFGSRPIFRLSAPAGADLAQLVESLRGDAEVQFAEEVLEGQTPESRRVTVWAIGRTQTQYANHWARSSLRLTQAHGVSTGKGVRVAVLDSGIDLDHPLLAPRLSRDAGGRLRGRDFVDNDADPGEVGVYGSDVGYGHGTHVAGLVAMAAPGARLMPARVLDPAGRGNAWVLAEAIGWALDPDRDPRTDDGAHVINLSLGTLQPTQLLKLATELATCEFDDDDDDFEHPGFDADRARCNRGRAAVVLAAAGNSGTDTEVLYPAAEGVKGSLAVTATRRDRTLAPFANRGSWIGLAAPGAGVVSSVPDDDWGGWSGTSMASPLAAGVATLVLRTLPPGGDPARATPRQWRPEDVVKRLVDRASQLCGTSLRQVDAAAAVRDVPPPDVSCP